MLIEYLYYNVDFLEHGASYRTIQDSTVIDILVERKDYQHNFLIKQATNSFIINMNGYEFSICPARLDPFVFEKLMFQILREMYNRMTYEIDVNTVWINKKTQDIYRVVDHADTVTDCPKVIYQRGKDGTIWTRPIHDWMRAFEKVQEKTNSD